jgi:hypothetical protein
MFGVQEWLQQTPFSMVYQSIDITANLDCAIRHLRFTLHKRCLWIDAVSMDQTDVQERNHQVQIMGRIYGTAQSVIVWVGPVDQTDLYVRAVLGAMQFHFSDGSPSTATLFNYICSVVSLLDDRVGHVGDPKDLVLSILDLIIDRPWFHRVWVVQELALATRATVHIGPFSFPWQPFESFVQWLPHHKADPLEHPELVERAARVARASCNRHCVYQLCRTLHLSATDARDKVFSILGVSLFAGAEIKPDYTKAVQRVFLEAAATVLKQERLDLYFNAPLNSLRESPALEPLPSLPSWVPDFWITGAAYTVRHSRKLWHQANDTSDFSRNHHRPTMILPGTPTHKTIETDLRWMHAGLPFPTTKISF